MNSRRHERTRRFLRAAGTLLFAMVLGGCTTLGTLMDRADSKELDDRLDAFASLESVLADADPDDPEGAEIRRRVENFVASRFERGETGDFREPNAVLRSQYLSWAVSAEFERAPELLRIGARDRSSDLVRHVAIQHMRDYSVAQFRDILVDTLRSEREFPVKIDVIKTMGQAEVEPGELPQWIDPLLEVYLDPTELSSVTQNAHRALVKLSGQTLHYSDQDAWRAWRRTLSAEAP